MCKSPFNERQGFRPPRREEPAGRMWWDPLPLTDAKIEASVDETIGTGIDCHLFQPAFGHVPVWKSRVYPFEEHCRFMKRVTGMAPSDDAFAKYLAGGGDAVATFVRRCRQKGMPAFISYRLNDSHGHEFVEYPSQGKKIPSWSWLCFSPLHLEHPQWRIAPDLSNWRTRVLNFALPEVRENRLAFIRELIENYDLDGFELDFMRHCAFFQTDRTTFRERCAILNAFVAEVRHSLDQSSSPGRRRWLGVRIPAHVEAFDSLGLDPAALRDQGVEIFNLSSYFFATQDGHYARIRKMVGPRPALYAEMTHVVEVGEQTVFVESAYDDRIDRKTTPTQMRTIAHLARARGCDGASTFNFFYYRNYEARLDVPHFEPPFEALGSLVAAEKVSLAPLHYFRGRRWREPSEVDCFDSVIIQPGQPFTLEMDVALPQNGCRQARLRLKANQPLGDSVWSARFNDAELAESADVSEPFHNRIPLQLGTASQHRAWTVPSGLVREGINRLVFTLHPPADPAQAVFVDLILE